MPENDKRKYATGNEVFVSRSAFAKAARSLKKDEVGIELEVFGERGLEHNLPSARTQGRTADMAGLLSVTPRV